MKRIFLIIIALFCWFGCSGMARIAKQPKEVTIVISADAHSRIGYGVQQLQKAIRQSGGKIQIVTGKAKGLKAGTILVGAVKDGEIFKNALKEIEGKEQGFALICKPDNSALIAGVDDSGALYGCLELAERIETNGGKLPEKLEFRDSPTILLRGPCIGMQRPEIIYDGVMYDYPYLPKTFPWFYDKQLWTTYLDLLAKHRSNTLYLWNGHPFTSILRLEKYPEAQEIETKQLEANIELFKWLCTEADRRGIWVVQFFYNIHLSHTLARHHGIAYKHRKPTPLLRDYTSHCITEFIKNYPHVGLMMCLGEDLADEYDAEWLTDVIIPAVKAGLKPGQQQPPIIVRNHSTPIEDVLGKAAPLYDNIYTMAKYTSETLASDKVAGGPGPQIQLNEWQLRHRLAEKFMLIINVHCVCNLEPFRWGSPSFVRRAMKSCAETGIKGLHLFPMRYWDWPYTADKVEPKLLQPERDWIWYAIWGRYAWNPYRDPNTEQAFWTRQLAERYGSEQAGKHILAAYESAGEVMPNIVRNLSAQPWNIEAHTLGQTLQQFFRSRLWYSGPGESIARYAKHQATGQKHEGETPIQAAKTIVENGDAALKHIQAADSHVTKNKAEFNRLLNDIRATRLVAHFYAHKTKAAINGLIFLENRNTNYLDKSVSELEKSVKIYRQLVELTDRTYADCASYHGPTRLIPFPASKLLVWSEALGEFEKELEVVKHNAELVRKEKGAPKSEVKSYPPVNITTDVNEQVVYKIEKGAKVYTDKDNVIEKVPAELVGLNALRIKSSAPYSVSFSCDKPVRVFAAFSMRSWEAWGELPRYDDGSEDWTLYAPQAAIISKRTYDIYYRDFDAGKVAIQYDRRPFAILGITKKEADLVPVVSRDIGPEIFDWRISR